MKLLARLSLSFLCAAIAGCGQAAYEERLNTKLEQLQHEAKFNALGLEPVPVLGTPYQLRLPNAFFGNTGGIFTLDSPNPITGQDRIPPEMLQPPFVNIPGMKAVFQAAAQDERGVRLPYFCYIASTERSQQPAEAEPPAEGTPAEGTPAEGEPKPPEENANPAEKKPDEAASSEPQPGEAKQDAAKPPADENAPAKEASGENPFAVTPAEQKAADEKSPEKKAPEAQEKPAGEGENPAPPENAAEEKPAKPAKALPLEQQILAELNKAFGGKQTLKWETVACETPSRAQPLQWRRVVVEGEQDFRYINSDATQKLPGKFELYAFPVKHDEVKGDSIDTSAPFVIFIGWRAADLIQGQAPIQEWARRTAGTLTGF